MSGLSFRALHNGPSPLIIPNPWDVGSARILAAMGFQALASTSAGMSFAMGVREGGASWDTTLAHCKSLVDATPLPVSADLEKGIGDSPESAAETVKAAAAIGLAGCSIEDFTGDLSAPIYNFDLAVARIKAAAEAARALPYDFVLTARAENFSYGHPDFSDTLKRLRAFEAAGADVVYAPDIHDLAQIKMLCDSVQVPVNIVMGLPGPTYNVEQLKDAGVKRISLGSTLARYAYGSLISASREMLDNADFTFAQSAAGFKEIEGLLPPS